MKQPSLLWIVGLFVLLGWAGCDRPEQEEVKIEGVPLIEGKDLSEVVEVPVARPVQTPETPLAWPERSSSSEPAFTAAKKLFRKPAFEPIDLDALTVYVEGDLLPEDWLKEWSRQEGIVVVQRTLAENDQPPGDGDVLIVPPARIIEWAAKGLLQPFPAGEYLSGLSSAFLGHPFDPVNRWSRPVRWSPFLFIAPADKATVYQRMSLEQLLKNPQTAWPDDPALLAAVRLKDQGASANTRRAVLQRKVLREVTEWTEGRRIRLGDGWRKVAAGETAVTLARAAGRISAPSDKDLAWWFPEGGTLVALQVVAVASSSKRTEAANRLIGFLLAEESQGKMVEASGYFPVRMQNFDKLAVGGVRLPDSKGWLDKAEFLWRENKP